MSQDSPRSQRCSFEEYKLYYESAEKVTDRRLATNTWNYGLCTAVMVAIATLANWGLAQPGFGVVTVAAIVVLSGMGILLCALWKGQIRDFKDLNSAKFEVLNAMAPLVQFDATETVVSAIPFMREWDILKAKEATREVEAMRIVALRSSNAELLVPTAFRWLFVLIMCAALATAIVNWRPLIDNILALKPQAASQNKTNDHLEGQP
jgi:hypothetical protein